MLNYVQQDITTVTHGIIAHGVNCQATMGSGVAKALYTKYPVVRREYIKADWLGREYLGDTMWITINRFLAVVNCYTQEDFGYDGRVYASLDAVEKCLAEVMSYAVINDLPLYIPMIGSDRGGLSWPRQVAPMIERLLKKYPANLTVCLYKETP